MGSNRFEFKQFTINQDGAAFKVGTDGALLGSYADISGVKHILDIGAGTGLITLMLAQRSNAKIVAIEPDHDSFVCMCQNFDNSPWSGRIEAIETTFQEMKYQDKFDLIVTNPPYFSNSLKNPDIVKSKTRHNDALSPADILKGVGNLLGENGKLQLILPYVEGNLFVAEAAEYGLYCADILKIKSLPTSEIKRLILTFGKEKVKPAEKFLTINSGKRHEFTEGYVELVKDFYLKF